MKQDNLNRLASVLQKKANRICSFKSYDNSDVTHPTISHSAKNNVAEQIKKDRERPKEILQRIEGI